MTIEQLQEKYRKTNRKLQWKGWRNKIIISVLLIPASYQAYANFLSRFGDKAFDHLSPFQLILAFFALYFLFCTAVIFIPTLSFVANKAVNQNQLNFKKDFFVILQKEIPELKEYYYRQKLHPKIIEKSNLFQSNYSDYNGDDFLRGRYKSFRFELCELHIRNLFKNVFNGCFVHLVHPAGSRIVYDPLKEKNVIKDFEKKFHAQIDYSVQEHESFFSFKLKGDLLSISSAWHIRQINEEMEMFVELVRVLQHVIDYCLIRKDC